MTYERLINSESEVIGEEIINYPKEPAGDMMKFVAISIVVMAIIFGSLLLFHLL